MRGFCIPVFALGLGLLAGCDQNGAQSGPDMRAPVDMRSLPGNVGIGAACDENRACPADPMTMAPSRCATIQDFDAVGACAPSCRMGMPLDCDTDQPGQAYCAVMPASGKSECVLFCDPAKKLGRECPQSWTCVSVQTYRICRPPQDKIIPDMRM